MLANNKACSQWRITSLNPFINSGHLCDIPAPFFCSIYRILCITSRKRYNSRSIYSFLKCYVRGKTRFVKMEIITCSLSGALLPSPLRHIRASTKDTTRDIYSNPPPTHNMSDSFFVLHTKRVPHAAWYSFTYYPTLNSSRDTLWGCLKMKKDIRSEHRIAFSLYATKL